MVQRDLAHVLGQTHRQSPGRVDGAGEHIGDAATALFSRRHRPQQGVGGLVLGHQGVHPAADDHHHGGSAGVGYRLHQLALHSGEVKVDRVAGLAHGGVDHQARTGTHEYHRHARHFGGFHRVEEARPVLATIGAAKGVGDLGVRERCSQACQRSDMWGEVWSGGERTARLWELILNGAFLGLLRARAATALVDDLQVRGVVVVTLQQSRVVGVGANHRHAGDMAGERQHPVVLQQHRALGGGTASQGSLGRCVEDRHGRVWIHIGRFEETQLELLCQHPGTRLVHQCLVEASSGDLVGKVPVALE